MAELAHKGENLLDEVRGGKVDVTTDVMNALFQTSDALKELLGLSKDGGDPTSLDTHALVADLIALAGHAGVEKPKPAPAAKAPTPPAAPAAKPAEAVHAVSSDLMAEIMNDPQLAGGGIEEEAAPAAATPAASTSGIDPSLLADIMNDPQLSGGPAVEEKPAVKAPEKNAEVVATPAEVQKIDRRGDDRRQGNEDRRQGGRRNEDTGEKTIRVDTARLDQVMNLVGELVLARNSLMRQLEKPETKTLLHQAGTDGVIMQNLEFLSRVTQDLQLSVLQTRMQPIKKVFDKIPRQVRELKSQLSKQVDLIIEGEMTEVDKTLVDELSDPMVHLVRNALDHGIETPEVREASGKSPVGTLSVRAFYEGNNVVIQIAEDGKGIDPEKIKKAALKKGLIDEAKAAQMTDKEAIRLIFEPGFSTAEKVSDVSGRGVGMDVVNTKIASVKGIVNIESQVGVGTTISIYLPLTLAIIQALVVEVAGEGFAVPIATITEVMKLNVDEIHEVNDEDVIEVRGEVLPLFYLAKLTKAGEAHITDERKKTSYIVIVRDGHFSMGLVVDKLLGQEEAVVKPITDAFKYHAAISGATITGDGGVNMILDVSYLMRDLAKRRGG
jgi:two-component system chemotaxis sensor kinase CheA